MPRAAARKVDTTDHKIGQDKPRMQRSTGDAKDSLDAPQIEVVDRPVEQSWAEDMAFNESQVKVLVHESTDKNAEAVVEVFCNGVPQRFIRGRAQDVKRKFVAVLARAKMTTYSQEKVRDDDGNESYRNIPHTALRYPFSVVADSDPRGADWLTAVLAEG